MAPTTASSSTAPASALATPPDQTPRQTPPRHVWSPPPPHPPAPAPHSVDHPHPSLLSGRGGHLPLFVVFHTPVEISRPGRIQNFPENCTGDSSTHLQPSPWGSPRQWQSSSLGLRLRLTPTRARGGRGGCDPLSRVAVACGGCDRRSHAYRPPPATAAGRLQHSHSDDRPAGCTRGGCACGNRAARARGGMRFRARGGVRWLCAVCVAVAVLELEC